jgi:hypothetical protein
VASTDGSTDGSTTSEHAQETAASAARRRARTAAEQRHEAAAASNDPEVLAADIEKTREELAETLDAIADKVSPKRVAGRTKQKVGDAVKEGAGSAAATVKSGAASLKEAVHDKREAMHAGGEGLPEALESVGDLPEPGVAAGAGVGGAVAAPAGSPGLRPVPHHQPPAMRLGPPALAGAAAALVVALFVLRRRRTHRSRWR